MEKQNEDKMNKIVSFAKRKGFVFPSSEIYGGFAGTETLTSERTNYGLGKTNETILSGEIKTN